MKSNIQLTMLTTPSIKNFTVLKHEAIKLFCETQSLVESSGMITNRNETNIVLFKSKRANTKESKTNMSECKKIKIKATKFLGTILDSHLSWK